MSRAPMSPEENAIEKRHNRTTYRASVLATLASMLTIVGVVGSALMWLGRPAAIAVLAEALSPTVQAQVRQQLGPLNGAFKIILEQQIADLQRDVDRLEFERRASAQPGSAVAWTLDKVNELRDKSNRLDANRMALAAIVAAEKR